MRRFGKSRSSRPPDIGLGLRKLRQTKRLSQQAVAKALGISRNAYIAWESNKVDITFAACMACCDLFSVSITDFLFNYVKMPVVRT